MTIIAGNFKANLTRIQVATFAKELDSILTDMQTSSHLQVDIFPSHTALLTNNFKHFHIGAQNAYFAQNGGFTGEIGLSQLQEFNINRLIIGIANVGHFLVKIKILLIKNLDSMQKQDLKYITALVSP